MASSKPQSQLIIYGTIYLPVVSLSLLVGFFLSLALPVVLSFFISAMDSALFVLLPQLWNALLSWITPPCLFVLLNSIIFALTASSGMLSSSGSGFRSSDFYTNFFGKMEGSPKQSSEALMEDLSAGISCTNFSASIQHQSCPAPTVEVPSLCVHRSCAVFDAHGTCQAEKSQFFDAQATKEGEEEDEEEEEKEDGEGEGENEEDGKDEEADSFQFSKLGMESRSFSFSYAQSRIIEEEGIENEDGNGDDWPSSGYSQQAMVNKTLSFFCKEGGDYVHVNSRSVPASPHSAMPPKANSIKRSLSVDSASLQGNQSSSLPSESLSDEAFKRKVEDFISRMNAQLRNEAK